MDTNNVRELVVISTAVLQNSCTVQETMEFVWVGVVLQSQTPISTVMQQDY